MSNKNPIVVNVDPAWALPDAPTRGQPVSASCFARLLAAAKEGGWPAVWRVWASGDNITEGDGCARPARRRTLGVFLDERRPDLRALLEDAANEKRDRLLNDLETEAEKIALGPGDITTDFDKNGNVTRTRVDRRNKLYAVLQLLKAHDRERYGDHRRVDVNGTINHDHTARLTGREGITITPDEVQKLSPEKAGLLLDLLGEIMDARNEQRDLERSNRDGTPRMLPAQSERGYGDRAAEGGPPAD